MRKEDWNRGLGEIDPELIEGFLEQKAEHVRRGRGRSYLQWIAVAACVCLVIAATVVIPIALRYGNDRVLEIPDESAVSESMEETGDITSKDHNSQQGDDISSDRMSYSKVYDESDYPDMLATEGIIYMLSPEGDAYYVKGYEGTDTEVYIPATYEGLPVTRIYSWTEGFPGQITYGAFLNNKYITSVFVGKNVETIDISAFCNCSNLETIVFPDSVRQIYADFIGCQNLANIVISDNVEHIYRRAFEKTAYFQTESNWENGALYIGNHLYRVNKVGNTYVVREGTKSIVQYAFYQQIGDNELTKIILPDSLEIIGEMAFFSRSNLVDVKLPQNIKKIKSNILWQTGYYQEASNWENGMLYNGEYLLYSKEIEGHVQIREGTRLIADYALYHNMARNNEILSIVLPESLEIIGDNAFGMAHKLLDVYNLSSIDIENTDNDGGLSLYARNIYTSLDMPTKFMQQGDYTIYCDGEKDIYVLVQYLGNDAEIVLPSNINGHSYEIVGHMFYKDSNITKITVPKGVTVIGEGAFAECKNLTDVVIDSECIIGRSAFESCKNLDNITLSDDVKSIEEMAFYNTAYYNDDTNWQGDELYIGKHLVCILFMYE